MRIGKAVARHPDWGYRPGTVGTAQRAAPDRRRGSGTARRGRSDPRMIGRRPEWLHVVDVEPVREFDECELDPAFDEFGDLADYVDGLALHVRCSLPRVSHDEPGTGHD